MKPLILSVLILLLAPIACTPTPESITVDVYFQDVSMYAVGTEPYEKAVTRTVAATDDIPLAVIEQLFLGPTAEEQTSGLALVRSGATGFSEFHIDSGVAHITLTGKCDSGGSTYTIANLIFANLAQFPEIQGIKIYDENGETEVSEGSSSSIPYCLEP